MKISHIIKKSCRAFAITPIILGVMVGVLLFAPVVLALETGVEFGEATGLGSQDIRVTIMQIVRVILGLLGIIAIVLLVYGGFVWMTSGGSEEKIGQAKKIITNTVIGLIIILTSFALATFIINSLLGATGAVEECNPNECVACQVKCNADGNGTVFAPGECNSQSYCSLPPEGPGCAKPDTITPTICRIIPSQGFGQGNVPQGAPGDYVTVEGWYFGDYVPTESRVLFGQDVAEVVQCEANAVWDQRANGHSIARVIVPEISFTTYDVSVVTALNGSSTGKPFSVIDAEPVPGLACIVPVAGTNNQTLTKAEGVRFGDDPGTEGGLFFASTQSADYSAWSSTLISEPVVPELGVSGYVYIEDEENNKSNEIYFTISCQADGECASGCCQGFSCQPASVCQNFPVITGVWPNDGAVGNFITITGRNFGNASGEVVFLGNEEDESTARVATFPDSVNPQCTNTWTNTQVVVVVPEGAIDGPIKLTTFENLSDKTNDSNGANISNFDVNNTVRPGLCQVDPNSGYVNTPVALEGVRFVAGQTSVFFAAELAGGTPSVLSPTRITGARVPAFDQNISVGVRAKVNEEFSNPMQFDFQTLGGPIETCSVDPNVCSPNASLCSNNKYCDLNCVCQPLISCDPVNGNADCPDGFGCDPINNICQPLATTLSDASAYSWFFQSGIQPGACSNDVGICDPNNTLCENNQFCDPTSCNCVDVLEPQCIPNDQAVVLAKTPSQPNFIEFPRNSETYQNIESLTDAITVSAWIKPPSQPHADGQLVAATYEWSGVSDDGNYHGWSFGDEFGCHTSSDPNCLNLQNYPWQDEFYFAINVGNSLNRARYEGFFAEYGGKWTHVAGTYDRTLGVIKLYINGEEVGRKSFNLPIDYNTDVPLVIGNRPDISSQGQWNGSISDVAIYGEALSGQEIRFLSQNRPVAQEKLVAHFGLNGNTTETITGESGNVIGNISYETGNNFCEPNQCEDDEDCAAGFVCNPSGVCEPIPEKLSDASAYSWFFTTSSFGPYVVETCNRTNTCAIGAISSPTPFSRLGTQQAGYFVSYARQDDGAVPIDSLVSAYFSTLMYEPSIRLAGNVRVFHCDVDQDNPDIFEEDSCDFDNPVQGDLVVGQWNNNSQPGDPADAHFISFAPNSLLQQNSWYLVKLSSKDNPIRGQNGEALAVNDVLEGTYNWVFKTRDSALPGELSCVYSDPRSNLAISYKEINSWIGRAQQQDFVCVDMNPQGLSWDWSTNEPTENPRARVVGLADPATNQVPLNSGSLAGIISPLFSDSNAWVGAFESLAVATKYLEDNPNPFNSSALSIALIETGDAPVNLIVQATSLRTGKSIFGEGLLYIDFSSPYVIDRFPDCGIACLNSKVGARFSLEMDITSVQNAMKLYLCADNSCETLDQEVVNFDQGVHLDTAEDPNTFTMSPKCYNLGYPGSEYCLIPGRAYRVVISQSAISKNTNKNLKGLNYSFNGGEEFDSYSWIFRTQEDYGLCLPSSIDVIPAEEQAPVDVLLGYKARPLSAVDACEPESGQRLNPLSWSWNWSSDQPPVADIVTFGADQNDRPAGLSSMCGNGFIDYGEACDPGLMSIEGCGLPGTPRACLWLGADPVADGGTCGNGNVDVGEDCDMINGSWPSYCSQSNCLLNDQVQNQISASCGNGVIEKNEMCEKPGTPGCDVDCTYTGSVDGRSRCGDGLIGLGEECDMAERITGGEPSDTDNNNCSAQCLIQDRTESYCRSISNNWFDFNKGNCSSNSECGNGYFCQQLSVATGNQDYNQAVCGNGDTEPGEQCDIGGRCSDNLNPCTVQNLSACANPATATCKPINVEYGTCSVTGNLCDNIGGFCVSITGTCSTENVGLCQAQVGGNTVLFKTSLCTGVTQPGIWCAAAGDCQPNYQPCDESCRWAGSVIDQERPNYSSPSQVVKTYTDGETYIRASIENYSPAQGGPEGEGYLLVGDGPDDGQFRVIERWPDCYWACENADVGARFSKKAAAEVLNTSNILIYKCADDTCAVGGLQPIPTENISIVPAEGNQEFHIYQIEDDEIVSLDLNTAYRVVIIDGQDGVTSEEGDLLVGLNYAHNSTEINAYSWTFKTKSEQGWCSLDRVQVVPSLLTLREGGEQYNYFAQPYTGPNQCDSFEQPLNPFLYDWDWDDIELTASSGGGFINAANFVTYNGNLARSFCSVSDNPCYDATQCNAGEQCVGCADGECLEFGPYQTVQTELRISTLGDNGDIEVIQEEIRAWSGSEDLLFLGVDILVNGNFESTGGWLLAQAPGAIATGSINSSEAARGTGLGGRLNLTTDAGWGAQLVNRKINTVSANPAYTLSPGIYHYKVDVKSNQTVYVLAEAYGSWSKLCHNSNCGPQSANGKGSVCSSRSGDWETITCEFAINEDTDVQFYTRLDSPGSLDVDNASVFKVGSGLLNVTRGANVPFSVIGHQPPIDADNQCRNVAIWATFSNTLDEATITKDNISVQKCNNSSCSNGYSGGNIAEEFVYKTIPGVCNESRRCEYPSQFVDSAYIEYINSNEGTSVCQINTDCTAGLVEITKLNTDNGFLDANSSYWISIKDGDQGIKNKQGESLTGSGDARTRSQWRFSTSANFCECNYVGVVVNPTSQGSEATRDYFSCAANNCPDDQLNDVAANQHEYSAICYDVRPVNNTPSRVPIMQSGLENLWLLFDPQSISNLLANALATPGRNPIVGQSSIYVQPEDKNGDSSVLSSIYQYRCSNQASNLCNPESTTPCPSGAGSCITAQSSSASQTIQITNFICNNPWPSLSQDGFWTPYIDSSLNYELFYCRDNGANQLLPQLSSVVDLDSGANVLEDSVFPVDSSEGLAQAGDALGIRTFRENPLRMSAQTWYQTGFCGGQQTLEYICSADVQCANNNILLNGNFDGNGGWRSQGANGAVFTSDLRNSSAAATTTPFFGGRLSVTTNAGWGAQLVNWLGESGSPEPYSLAPGSYTYSVYVKSGQKVHIAAQSHGDWEVLCENPNCNINTTTGKGSMCSTGSGDWERVNCNFNLSSRRNIQFTVRLNTVGTMDVDDASVYGRCVPNVPAKGSLQSLTVDNYRAVQDGRTVYAGATNLSGANLYKNNFLISHNQNAQSQTQEIFNRILDQTGQLGGWRFNRNITNSRVCTEGANNYIGLYEGTQDQCLIENQVASAINCSSKVNQSQCNQDSACAWLGNETRCTAKVCQPIYCLSDFDCPGVATCDASKSELIRDTKRVEDLVDTSIALREYNLQQGRYPALSAGSYVQSLSFSVWPSWNETLGDALGKSILGDPLNRFVGCTTETCWDAVNTQFNCPVKGYSYAYLFEGSDYRLMANLEFASGNYWKTIVGPLPVGSGCNIFNFQQGASGKNISTSVDCSDLGGDADGDGICTNTPGSPDNCPNTFNPNQRDVDGNDIGDACDALCPGDVDGDGKCDHVDICPFVYNPNQSNLDNDTYGDACDFCTDWTGENGSPDGYADLYIPGVTTCDTNQEYPPYLCPSTAFSNCVPCTAGNAWILDPNFVAPDCNELNCTESFTQVYVQNPIYAGYIGQCPDYTRPNPIVHSCENSPNDGCCVLDYTNDNCVDGDCVGTNQCNNACNESGWQTTTNPNPPTCTPSAGVCAQKPINQIRPAGLTCPDGLTSRTVMVDCNNLNGALCNLCGNGVVNNNNPAGYTEQCDPNAPGIPAGACTGACQFDCNNSSIWTVSSYDPLNCVPGSSFNVTENNSVPSSVGICGSTRTRTVSCQNQYNDGYCGPGENSDNEVGCNIQAQLRPDPNSNQITREGGIVFLQMPYHGTRYLQANEDADQELRGSQSYNPACLGSSNCWEQFRFMKENNVNDPNIYGGECVSLVYVNRQTEGSRGKMLRSDMNLYNNGNRVVMKVHVISGPNPIKPGSVIRLQEVGNTNGGYRADCVAGSGDYLDINPNGSLDFRNGEEEIRVFNKMAQAWNGSSVVDPASFAFNYEDPKVAGASYEEPKLQTWTNKAGDFVLDYSIFGWVVKKFML